ncbi:MAG: hypothetical protein J6N52_13725 [Clostridia bacterium]|nr:hypothetical protein [Clostridia bacterium]
MVSNSLKYKRITVFAGHYGSGKTNIAINYALMLRKQEKHVAIADLDIVNPYFRTKDCSEMLAEQGIRLISSEFAGSNVDLPSLPADVYSVLDSRDTYAVLDVGGDDRGALALGRYIPSIISENNYDMFFVINKFRPLTKNVQLTLEVMREIEAAAGAGFNAIVNNSNLGAETTCEDVLSSLEYARAVSEASGLPIAFTAVREDICRKLNISNAVPVRLYVEQSWQKEEKDG